MNATLTASAVFCAALISGCSSAPTLAVPTGDWEDFNQSPLPNPQSVPRPVANSSQQEPALTIYKPTIVAAFTPPSAATVQPGPARTVTATPVVVALAPTAPQSPSVTAPGVAAPVVAPPSAKPVALATVSPPSPAAVKPALKSTTVTPAKALGTQVGELAAKPSPAVAAVATVPVVSKPVPPPKPLQAWTVSPKDKTIRETLAKWSAIEGYTFNPIGRQHWTVPEDFDVVASDTMHGDFKTVVRRLIASTELTKTPLQPCFYSNRVVRVILINEECNTQTSQVRNQ